MKSSSSSLYLLASGFLLLNSSMAVPIWNCGTWCSSPPPPPPPSPPSSNTIVDVAVGDGRFTRLVSAVTSTGLAGTLSGPGPFTVFAPLDTAFAAVPAKFLQDTQYREHLRQVLLYHVVGNARVLAGTLTRGRSIGTLNAGQSITVTRAPPNVQLNGLVDVVLADVGASNGVIHVIDEVLLPAQVSRTILDLVVGTPGLTTLRDLLTSAGIASLFGNANDSFTVFAPTNEAFAKLPQSLLNDLTNPANAARLRDILQLHVVGGSVVLSSQLSNGQQIMPGLSVTSLNPPRVNNAVIGPANILASNGVVHLIDTVLIPPSGPAPTPMAPPAPIPTVAASSPLSFNCGTWCTTPVAAPVPTFRPPTTFGPPPSPPTPVAAPVPTFRPPSSFGPPPSPPTPVAAPVPTFRPPSSFGPPPSPPSGGSSIVDIAVNDGRFTTLVSVVTSLGLAGTLSGPGPFTVFAPTDEAFEDVPARFLEPGFSIHLRQVLLYHVVGSGAVSAGQLREGQRLRTLAGEDIVVTDYDLPTVELNDRVDVINADIRGSNGIIHVVDEVLVPSALTSTILDRVVASPFLSTLESLLITAGLAGTFDGTNGQVYTVFAPSNAAFSKLPSSLLNQLLDPANIDTLREVLLFHVVSGSSVPASTLTQGMQIKNGLTVNSLSPLRLNESVVTARNVLANNGIVHIIDTVLIPPSLRGSVTNALAAESSATRATMATIGFGALITSLLL